MRFTRLLALALILIPSYSFAAWGVVGELAVGNDTTSDNTLGPITITNTLEAGNVGICVIGYDEWGTGTTDGNTNQISSVTDSSGSNTWIEAHEHCNMQTSTTLNGSCVAIYYTKAGTQLTGGSSTITVTFGGSVRKAMTCIEATITSGNIVQITSGTNQLSNDGANVGSLSVATGSATEHLFIRGSACESNNTGYGADADYTAFPGSTTTSTANTGTTGTSHGARGERRIATEATSAASDPDYPSSAGTADCASAMVGMDEVTPPSCTAGLNMTLLGVGGCP